MKHTILQARVPTAMMQEIDEWRIAQGVPVLTRAEATRRLLAKALVANGEIDERVK